MEIKPEVSLASWQEAVGNHQALPARFRLTLIAGSLTLAAGCLGLGIYLHALSWYLAAAVIVAALTALLAQNRHPEVARTITVTSQRIVIDEQSFPLEELKGFSLQEDEGRIVITLEHARSTLFPTTCYYQSTAEAEARETLAQVLPEVEARPLQFADQLNRYFRF
jgi:hypothetical protein